MLNKAIEKIKIEMETNKKNSYIQVVGEFLLQHLQVNQGDAEKIVQGEKTIEMSLAEMRKAAEKNKNGNYAMFTPQEGFEIVLKYYGIDGASPISLLNQIDHVKQPVAPVVKEIKPKVEFNVELDF